MVARSVAELRHERRAVAIGTLDGVHLGHRRVLEAAVAAGLTPTVVTFDPHPRIAFGYEVELLTTLRRRLELIADAGIEDALVVEFDLDVARLEPEEFVEQVLRPIGTEVVVAGADFRFGRGRAGDLGLLRRLGVDARTVPLVENVSSSRIRDLLRGGEVDRAAELLGRPPEVEGTVVAGDARGGTLGFPTANLRLEPDLLVPAYGIYAGAAAGHRAAVSIGTNPHYGGAERRVEAHLLDFEGDLYGLRLVVELWRRLRDEQSFSSEEELVAQIGRDVEETRRAEPPS
ncbi:MAG TPA: riboflavin biosynthesis protein RibF [Gaiellaceae bacterium]|nr:riboflavin biosynthesis protein RibF [Gaiellaceae bacterium]